MGCVSSGRCLPFFPRALPNEIQGKSRNVTFHVTSFQRRFTVSCGLKVTTQVADVEVTRESLCRQDLQKNQSPNRRPSRRGTFSKTPKDALIA